VSTKVNVPGPIGTPLIPSTFDAKKVPQLGSDSRMGRSAWITPAFRSPLNERIRPKKP
jgi:hypothetical protein